MTKLFKNLGKYINVIGITGLFVFTFLLSNAVYVDHSSEYPWEPETFLGRSLATPNPIYHLSLFGFPYDRGWEEIMDYVAENNNGHFSTNERKSIPRFYVGLPKDTDNAGPYVSIVNPQSFSSEVPQEKVKYWASKYEPAKIIERRGRIVTRIYLLPPGDLVTIQNQGY